MRESRFTLVVASFALTLFLSNAVSAGQAGAASAPALVVAGDVGTPLTLTAAEFKALPRTRVEVESNGRTLTYEGVLMGEILERAGVPLGADLRGVALATYVLATATDGYQVVFSVAELDPALTGSSIIVADIVDGKPLVAEQGPLRIVVPEDTRASRSVRMLERLDVVRLRK